MADPLSVTAAFVGIIAATGQGIELLTNTIQNIRHAPESIRLIETVLQQLRPLLSRLEFTVREEPTDLILSAQIKGALENCNQACTKFSVSLAHWTRHSGDDKTSLRDNAKIGVFYQGRIRVLKEQLGQSIKILNVTLDSATYIKMSQQEATPKEFGNQMLAHLESRLTKSITEAFQDRNAATTFEQSMLPLDDTEEKQALVEEMKRQKAMIDAVEQTAKEALKVAVSQRTKQKIYDINATDSGIALAGRFNVTGIGANCDQDLSKVHASGRSISIAGVANNIDINSMYGKLRSEQKGAQTDYSRGLEPKGQTVIRHDDGSWEI